MAVYNRHLLMIREKCYRLTSAQKDHGKQLQALTQSLEVLNLTTMLSKFRLTKLKSCHKTMIACQK